MYKGKGQFIAKDNTMIYDIKNSENAHLKWFKDYTVRIMVQAATTK